MLALPEPVLPRAARYDHTKCEETNVVDPDDGKSWLCRACNLPIFSTPFIKSDDGNGKVILLHDECANLPKELKGSVLHPKMPLILDEQTSTTSTRLCYKCKKKCGPMFYRCPDLGCRIELDVLCAMTSIKILHRSHQHRLMAIRGAKFFSFTCDACGTRHGQAPSSPNLFYMCNACPFWIHPFCASLPNTIVLKHYKHQHEHPLVLNYDRLHCSMQDQYLDYYEFLVRHRRCSICGRFIESLGFYCCNKCRYSVHIMCAVSDDVNFIPVLIREARLPGLIHFPIPNEHRSVMRYITGITISATTSDTSSSNSGDGNDDDGDVKLHGYPLSSHYDFSDDYVQLRENPLSFHDKEDDDDNVDEQTQENPFRFLDGMKDDVQPLENPLSFLDDMKDDEQPLENPLSFHDDKDDEQSQLESPLSLHDDSDEPLPLNQLHEHPLILHNHDGNDDDDGLPRLCNACVQFISPPFYKCSECPDFFLHDCCARLPHTLTRHPAHDVDHPLFLLPKPEGRSAYSPIFYCNCCDRQCNGFSYSCKIRRCENFHLDVLCALMPASLTHDAHERAHILYSMTHGNPIQNNSEEYCDCCGDEILCGPASYECGTCHSFRIHARCALLPNTVTHKFDQHPLKLITTKSSESSSSSSGSDGDHDTIVSSSSHQLMKLMFCEICERNIDNRVWYYSCDVCEQSFHTDCIPCLDELSKIKFGVTSIIRCECDDCPFTLIRGHTVQGSRCGHCGEAFNDSGLVWECSKCYFRFHYMYAFTYLCECFA